MPTKRAWSLFIFALVIYFLANQTQVGWLYIFTDSLLGFLVVSFFYSRGMLKPLRAKRLVQASALDMARLTTSPHAQRQNGSLTDDLNDDLIEDFVDTPPTFYEDDPVQVTLQFSHHGLKPAFLVSGHEWCPFAPPADRDQPLFIPSLFRGGPLDLSYQTTCDRRGRYTFSTMRLASKGPFELFSAQRRLELPTAVLIYPSYHPLKRLRLA